MAKRLTTVATVGSQMLVDDEIAVNTPQLQELVRKDTTKNTASLQCKVKSLEDKPSKLLKTSMGTRTKEQGVNAMKSQKNRKKSTMKNHRANPKDRDNAGDTTLKKSKKLKKQEHEERKEQANFKNREEIIFKAVTIHISTTYDFIADIHKYPRHNAHLYLASMPAWYYFDRPIQLTFHNLTTSPTTVPEKFQSLLGLGLTFCSTPQFTPSQIDSTLTQFESKLLCLTYYASQGTVNDDKEFNTKMYITSTWTPDDWQIPIRVRQRLKNSKIHIHSLFKKIKNRSNLLRYQRISLNSLQLQDFLITAHYDTNISPDIMNTILMSAEP